MQVGKGPAAEEISGMMRMPPAFCKNRLKFTLTSSEKFGSEKCFGLETISRFLFLCFPTLRIKKDVF